MRCILAYLISIPLLCPVETRAFELTLACHTRSSLNADPAVLLVDRIKIDTDRKIIRLSATSTNDFWTYENRPYDAKLDFVDQVIISSFKEGFILAAGIRAQTIFGFNYQPLAGTLAYTFTISGKPGNIIFGCRKI